jgi:hypothetical protein
LIYRGWISSGSLGREGRHPVPLWECGACGRRFTTLQEVEEHRLETGHAATRIPVWEVKAVMMEKRLEPLARLIAERLNVPYEEYMERVRGRQRNSPPGVFTSTIIWQDALRLRLVKPGQEMPMLEQE